ncbi:hypothetical protein [Nitrospirillum iridis]|uniref:Uncharacterized protein n=1 Tax=Nitrospirillum iridis TaxID=765888 RepID=A0A7X0EI54_9PROT|nr:hypothetical protein [Nitrospirillum iridis]MBB6255419.1 hypothetical protein [Nitrospirillum iridis]
MTATLDSIRRHLVGLKMPRALETLDWTCPGKVESHLLAVRR